MTKCFLISDTHFGHYNILKFKDKEGDFLRPFKSVEEMDSVMIDNWNKVVGVNDKVYHLGDVAFCSFTRLKDIFQQLNGNKVLIKGNHDNMKLSQYAQLFKDVRAYHLLDNFTLSHIPIHTESLSRWKGNIHGHLHANELSDPRYFCVSVEQIDFTPIEFGVIREEYKRRLIENQSN